MTAKPVSPSAFVGYWNVVQLLNSANVTRIQKYARQQWWRVLKYIST